MNSIQNYVTILITNESFQQVTDEFLLQVVSILANGLQWTDITAKERIKRHLGLGNFITVCHKDDIVMGIAVWAKWICIHQENPTLYFNWLYVDPKYRRSRIAQKLVLRTQEISKTLGCEQIYLEEKDGSEAFYSSLGFTRTAINARSLIIK